MLVKLVLTNDVFMYTTPASKTIIIYAKKSLFERMSGKRLEHNIRANADNLNHFLLVGIIALQNKCTVNV